MIILTIDNLITYVFYTILPYHSHIYTMHLNTPKRKLFPNKFFNLLPLCGYPEMSRIFSYYHIPSQYTISHIPSTYTLYIYISHIPSQYTISHIPSQYTISHIPSTYTLYIYPLHIPSTYTSPLHIHLAYTTSHIPYTPTFHLSRYISIYTRRSRTFNNYPNIAKLYIEN